MIPARFAPVVFAFFLSMIASAIISCISTIMALGVSADLPGQWLRAWLPSWAFAFPTVVLVAPVARRIVGRLTKPPN